MGRLKIRSIDANSGDITMIFADEIGAEHTLHLDVSTAKLLISALHHAQLEAFSVEPRTEQVTALPVIGIGARHDGDVILLNLAVSENRQIQFHADAEGPIGDFLSIVAELLNKLPKDRRDAVGGGQLH